MRYNSCYLSVCPWVLHSFSRVNCFSTKLVSYRVINFIYQLRKSIVNQNSLPQLRIIKEVSWFNISMVNAQRLNRVDTFKQLIEIEFDVLHSEFSKETLFNMRKEIISTMKGWYLKYSKTMWILSFKIKRSQRFGVVSLPLTSWR